jgi:hypothetical protein
MSGGHGDDGWGLTIAFSQNASNETKNAAIALAAISDSGLTNMHRNRPGMGELRTSFGPFNRIHENRSDAPFEKPHLTCACKSLTRCAAKERDRSIENHTVFDHRGWFGTRGPAPVHFSRSDLPPCLGLVSGLVFLSILKYAQADGKKIFFRNLA